MNRINLWNVIVVQLYEEFRFMRDKYDFLKTKKRALKVPLNYVVFASFYSLL
jgi:hypothetical protein